MEWNTNKIRSKWCNSVVTSIWACYNLDQNSYVYLSLRDRISIKVTCNDWILRHSCGLRSSRGWDRWITWTQKIQEHPSEHSKTQSNKKQRDWAHLTCWPSQLSSHSAVALTINTHDCDWQSFSYCCPVALDVMSSGDTKPTQYSFHST